MQKKLTALAALAAASLSSAFAADITTYGVINTGLSYTRADTSVSETTDTFEMDAGNYLGSRFGLKGSEEINDRLTVGFVLENGFSSDTGALGDGGRLFGREASIWLRDDVLGTLRFGRLTALTGSTGTSGLMAGKFSATSTGWGVMWGHNAVFAGKFLRLDNVVMYSTPKWAGLQLHAQYSSGIDQETEEDGEENSGSATRYMGLGAQYFTRPFSTIAVVDSYRYADTAEDPSLGAYLSLAYDFEVVKVFATGNYFRDMRYLGKAAVDDGIAESAVFGNGVAKDGYALNFGVTAPIASGKLYAAVGYMDAESSADADKAMKRYTVSVGYDYNLSKRTVFYVGAGYMLDRYEDFGADVAASDEDAAKYGVTFGLSHRF